MSYASSKNLTVYDVLTIASMIEREAGVPSQRKDVASVIYNRLHEGMPLGIDATIRFATGNYSEPLTESQLAATPPTTPAPTSACRRGRSTAPAWPRSKPPPIPPRPATSSTSTSRGRATNSPSPRTKPNSKPTSTSTTRPAKQTAATSPPPAGNSDAAPGGHRLPGSALALAGDAERGAGRSWGWRRSGATRRSRSTPRGSPSGCGDGRTKFAGANVTVPHKHAALALADEPERGGAGGRRSQHARLRRGEVRADNTDADGFLAALPASPRGRAGAGAGGRRRRPGGGLGAGARAGRGRGLEPHCRAGGADLRGAGRDRGRRARPGRLRADRQHQRRGPARRGSLRAAAARPRAILRRSDGGRHGLRRAAPSLLGAAGAAGAAAVDGLEILVQQGALSLQHLDRSRAAARGDARRRPRVEVIAPIALASS